MSLGYNLVAMFGSTSTEQVISTESRGNSEEMQALMRALKATKQSMLKSIKYLALAAGVAIVAGFYGLPEKTDETATWNNNKLYTEAQDALSGGDFGKCAKYFEALEGRDPFGHFAQQAQINVAYCNWKDSETANSRPGHRPLHQAAPGPPGHRLRVLPEGDDPLQRRPRSLRPLLRPGHERARSEVAARVV